MEETEAHEPRASDSDVYAKPARGMIIDPVRSHVEVRSDVLQRLGIFAQSATRLECCGLLAGRKGVITSILPATNALASPTAYEIAPEELFRLVREIRAAGLDLMGIYHSHPHEKNEPSSRDIERAYYPEAAYFILSPQPDTVRPVRAFSIRDGRVTELEIAVL